MKLNLQDIVLKRDSNGQGVMNIPRGVIHHSPTGIEWGYGGSGPADTALSILNNIIPPGEDGEEPVKCFEGVCSKSAWDLHQDLKFQIIARMPKEGGKISSGMLRSFLREHGIEEANSLHGVLRKHSEQAS